MKFLNRHGSKFFLIENFSKVTVVFFKNMRPTIKICVFQVK